MQPFRVHSQSPAAARALCTHLAPLFASRRNIVFVCIGTPQVAGDAFGPLVGSALKAALPVPVYGTVAHPVADPELRQLHATLAARHKQSTVIALDSALGLPRQTGSITAAQGGIQPGRAVGKQRGAIGDYRIKAVVSSRTKDPLGALEQTPLQRVKEMAQIVSDAIIAAWNQRPATRAAAHRRQRAAAGRGARFVLWDAADTRHPRPQRERQTGQSVLLLMRDSARIQPLRGETSISHL